MRRECLKVFECVGELWWHPSPPPDPYSESEAAMGDKIGPRPDSQQAFQKETRNTQRYLMEEQWGQFD